LKNNKLQSLFIALVLLAIAILAIFIIAKKAEAPIKNDTTEPAQTENPPTKTPPPEIKPQDVQAAETPDTAKINISELKIPILMYHHIRDYNDPNDKIGTNLSVSIENFSKQLDLLVSRGYKTTNFLDIERGKVPDKPVILTFDDGYDNFYKNAYPELKKRSMTAVAYVITTPPGGNYMTTDQLKEISSNNIEVGGHTVSHPDLTNISFERLTKEVSESKNILEEKLGSKVISFCYPAGKYNDAVMTAVKSAGYSFATTTKSGRAHFDKSLELQRYRVNQDTKISSFIP